MLVVVERSEELLKSEVVRGWVNYVLVVDKSALERKIYYDRKASSVFPTLRGGDTYENSDAVRRTSLFTMTPVTSPFNPTY